MNDCCPGTPSGYVTPEGEAGLMCDDTCTCPTCMEQRDYSAPIDAYWVVSVDRTTGETQTQGPLDTETANDFVRKINELVLYFAVAVGKR